MSPKDRKKLDVWPGPIYLPYKPKYQAFFEVVMLLRRLILAIALSMIPSSSTFQTLVVWVVLMASAIIHHILRPYDTSRRVGEANKHLQSICLVSHYTVYVTSNISEDSLQFTTTKRFQFQGKGGFPLSRIFTCVHTRENFSCVNKIEARYKVMSLYVKLREVQLLRLRAIFHALIASILLANVNFTQVKITRQWKSTPKEKNVG